MLSLAYRSLLGLFLFILLHASASASDQITGRSYYEDTSREMTFSEIQQQKFRAYSGILSLGYLKSPVWIHLRIDPHETVKGSQLVVRIRPEFLDKVELFDPVYLSLGRVVTGDEEATPQQQYESLNLNFLIPAGHGPRDIWLKVTSNSTMLLDAQILPLAEALKEDRVQELKYSAYLALLLIFVLWALLYFSSYLDWVIGTFALTQFLGLVSMAGLLGFYRGLWPLSSVLSEGTFVDCSIAPFVASGFRLDYLLLRESKPNSQLLNVAKWGPIYLPVYLLLMLLGYEQQAFQMSMYMVFFMTLLYLILALTIPTLASMPEGGKPLLSRRSLICLYSFIFVALSLSALPSLGFFSASFLVFDGFLLYSILSGCAFLLILHMRTKEILKRGISLERDFLEAERRTQHEVERRQEQSQFLSMLTHELRTSLSVVSMVLGAKDQTPTLLMAAEKSIRDIGEIIERCLNVDKHEAGQIDLNLSNCDLDQLVRELIEYSNRPDRVRLEVNSGVAPYTDGFWVRLILANLIDNALKYSPVNSPINVYIDDDFHGEASFTRISVTNFVGRAGQPDAEKVFQKYYRHPRAHAFTGTGLGLFLSSQLAHRLEGKLEYVPTDTHVRFILCLPRSISL
jgi:signal transduction histidine kinase